MEKLSGLILDVYDDRSSGGEVLRSIFPDEDSLPDLVKTAHAITSDERGALPDDAFALVLVDGDVEMKKFATVDAGNTALSVEYFLKTGHKLPEEAQKVAAVNLCAACGWHGIEPPETLVKVANYGSFRKLVQQESGTLARAKKLVPKKKGIKKGPKKESNKGLYLAGGGLAALGAGGVAADEYSKSAGVGHLALGAMMIPGTAKEVKGNLQATKGARGQVMTPQQMQYRRMQMGG